MPLILGANSVSGYTVKNSLRFNSGSTDYLTRTPSTNGNRRTYTISTWVKRSTLGTTQTIIVADPSTYAFLRFQTDDKLYFYGDNAVLYRSTTQVFRDVSAWYHIVVAINTTLATANDRVKIYVNGVQITAFDTTVNPTQNTDMEFNSTTQHWIGCFVDTTQVVNGYMSEFYMIDGQALDPTSFGETNTLSGIWIPKAYTSTFGTNGFYLQFKNSASLGTDSSGNGNTFTVNNLTSIDQTTDTPTNNFATLNPLAVFNTTSPAYSEGNLKATWSSGGNSYTNGTFLLSKGKWYFEVKGSTNDCAIFARDPSNYTDFDGTYGFSNANGNKITNGSGSASQSAGASNDILQMALDMDNNKLWVGRNGTYFASGDPSAGTNAFISSLPTDLVPSFQNYGNNIQANFGSPIYSANSYTDGAGFGNFSYAVPSGYYSLNTKNLATFG